MPVVQKRKKGKKMDSQTSDPVECTAVILAGGENKRFQGRHKALLEISGKPLVRWVYDVVSPIFREVILVSNASGYYLDWDTMIVSDLFSVRSSLTGIHTSLFTVSTPFAFVFACDTPFLQENLVKTMLGCAENKDDVIIPETSKGLEPLCAIYSVRCLKTVEKKILSGGYRIQEVFRNLRVKKIEEKELKQADPGLISFFNINTPGDLDLAKRLVKEYNLCNK